MRSRADSMGRVVLPGSEPGDIYEVPSALQNERGKSWFVSRASHDVPGPKGLWGPGAAGPRLSADGR